MKHPKNNTVFQKKNDRKNFFEFFPLEPGWKHGTGEQSAMETVPQRNTMDKTTHHTQEIHPMIRINTRQMEQNEMNTGDGRESAPL